MKKLLLILVFAVGCLSVPTGVVSSIEVLKDNTHKLAKHYAAELDRAEAPAGQTEESWKKHVAHEKALMSVNNTLADKVHKWAAVSEED